MLTRLPSSLESCEVEQLAVLTSLKHHAKHRADDAAIACSGEYLTFAQTLQRAAQIRRGLEARGVVPGATVAVSIPRTIDLLPLLLAVWSLRAAYVPVDPSYPVERQQYILDDAGVRLLVVQGEANDALSFGGDVVAIETLTAAESPSGSETHCNAHVAAFAEVSQRDDIAYIIYTSGSTGNPKGVAVSQGNVENFLLSMQQKPGLTPQDRLLAVTTISFDIHVLELFLPIVAGACVVVASRDEARSAPALRSLIKRHVCTVLQATPSTWRMLLDNHWQPPVPLRALIGGEALPADLLPILHGATCELWNMYGPTETTVWSTCQLLTPGEDDILIGCAIANTSLHVVDEQLQPVADGTPGELLIGGDGVTLGYYHKPELTAEKFITAPALEPGVVYRTGDLVCRQANGALKYINRIDGQIKLRGYRIEPGDIEARMQQLDAIDQAVVVRVDLAAGNECLVCCYLGRQTDSLALKNYANANLPGFMVPQHFLQFDEFPKTDNLKINRRALAEDSRERVLNSAKTVASDARDNLDRCIIRVWENILNVPGVGIDDDFFNLGGHSLLALQAVEVMSKATGIDFASDVIFTSPTIRQILDNPNHGFGQEVTVTKLNDADAGTPIYCLCGMRIYNELAQQFAASNPVYCVFGKQEIAMLNQPLSSDAAGFDSQKFLQAYMDAILRQHQGGPIILAGFSFGGVLAVEVAQQLECLGIAVQSVVMIDSYMPSAFQRRMSALVEDVGQLVRRQGLLKTVQIGLARTWFRSQRPNRVGGAHSSQKEREEVFDFAAEKFEKSIHKYSGRVFLVRATQMDLGLGMRGRQDYGWRKYLNGDLHIKDYDTDHTGVMTGSGLTRMCQDILAYLKNPI
ncbi:amino acid adenylation domain-containing protein [Halioxenophilus aromaticivorans]|uniref:Carrier domain-containing protein n=1 Tax=Halioxenophilus aromaticivorans TaxID=1306992 RepID=A0AAV3U8J8_9ALTE